MVKYPAVFKKVSDGWEVDFPDLDGCFTDGDSLEDAKERASEVLSAYIEASYSKKIKIDPPTERKGRNVFMISPVLSVAFALSLRAVRERLGMSQGDVAAKLGVAYQAYQRIENPAKSNPSLRTIEKIEGVLGEKIINFD